MASTTPRENVSANRVGTHCVNVYDLNTGAYLRQVLCFGTEKKARLKAKLAAMTPGTPEYAETRRAYLAA